MTLFREADREQFADEVLAAVRERAPVAWLETDEFAIGYLTEGTSEPQLIYLETTFREAQGESTQERAGWISRLVGLVSVPEPAAPEPAIPEPAIPEPAGPLEENKPESWEEVRPQLRLVLRPVSMGQSTPMRSLSRPALPFLAEYVVIDDPTAMAYVPDTEPARWGVDADEVFAAARRNLADSLAGLRRAETGDSAGIIRLVDDGDSYFTSLLLVDGLLASMGPQVGGRPVAFIPDRDSVLVTADDPAMLNGLFDLMEREYLDAPRDLSPMAYTVDDAGVVVPYKAPEPGALADRVHRAELVLATREYGAQAEMLEAAHERDNIGIFVASVMVSERPDGSLFSACGWPDHCDALLPEADFVVLGPLSSQYLVPWPVVVSLARLTAAPGYAPARYRVRQYPPAPVMRQLEAQAIPVDRHGRR